METERIEAAMIEKTFDNLDDAMEWMSFFTEFSMTTQTDEVDITVRRINDRFQVAIWEVHDHDHDD
jgi:hypothetical protein